MPFLGIGNKKRLKKKVSNLSIENEQLRQVIQQQTTQAATSGGFFSKLFKYLFG